MKKILVTGSRSDIVKAVIDQIVDENYFLYLTTHTDNQLKHLRDKYKNHNNVECFKLDITRKEDRDKILDLDIDILVNHAGIGYGGSISEIPFNLVRDNFETNVFSSFEIVQIVLNKMIKKGKGKVIIMSSLAGIMPFKFLGVYSATKASIIMLATSLRDELKLLNKDIDIILIEPGAYRTGFNQVMLENKYKWMNNKSYFKDELELIRKKETFLWNLIEKRNLNSIVSKYKQAITSNHPKKIYRAPISQVILTKMYVLFKL